MLLLIYEVWINDEESWQVFTEADIAVEVLSTNDREWVFEVGWSLAGTSS